MVATDTDANKKRGLGRGLNALFGDEENFAGDNPAVEIQTSESDPSQRRMMDIARLQAGRFQPRQLFNQKSLEELSVSIRQHGLLQPILIRAKGDDGMYEIVAGERRWRAAQLAQIHEVPVIIRDMNDNAALEIGLIENLQREDLNPIDEGRALKQLAEDFSYSHDEIAERVGKSRSYVANMVRLLDLNPVVSAMVNDGRLSAGHARALLSLPGDQQEEQAKKIVALGLNVRQAEQLVSEVQGRSIKKRGKESDASHAEIKEKDINTLALEREISNVVGMAVSIDMKDNQEGVMSIRFKTLDQLDEVLHRLSHNPGRLAVKG